MKIRQILALASILIIAACSSDSGGTTPTVDASTSTPDAPDAPPVVTICNPLTSAECAANEKCSFEVVSDTPAIYRTTCVPNGAGLIDEGCGLTEPTLPSPESCARDLACSVLAPGIQECKQLCDISNPTCPADNACSGVQGIFEDYTAAPIGFCKFACNAVTQNCPALTDPATNQPITRGCYPLINQQGAGSCLVPGIDPNDPTDPTPGQFGDSCSFLNGCAAGYACLLPADGNSSEPVCQKVCESPVDDCIGAAGTGTPVCQSLRYFYTDGAEAGIPEELGLCMNCEAWTDPATGIPVLSDCPGGMRQDATAVSAGKESMQRTIESNPSLFYQLSTALEAKK